MGLLTASKAKLKSQISERIRSQSRARDLEQQGHLFRETPWRWISPATSYPTQDANAHIPHLSLRKARRLYRRPPTPQDGPGWEKEDFSEESQGPRAKYHREGRGEQNWPSGYTVDPKYEAGPKHSAEMLKGESRLPVQRGDAQGGNTRSRKEKGERRRGRRMKLLVHVISRNLTW